MRQYSVKCIAFAISLLLMAVVSEGAQKNLSGKNDQSLRKGEVRATLDPGQFKNPMIRNSYQAAKDIPWILDSIYCFCYCAESFKHKSLLSCYVDMHAAR
jgi:hypothetical protein